MSDWTDEASRVQELLEEAALDRARREGESLARDLNSLSGACLNCAEPVEGRRFCDEFCREDFEKRNRGPVRRG